VSADAQTLAVYNAKAADYATRFGGTGKPGKHLSRFMAPMPEGARVLDLGCGPGASAAHMAAAGLVVDAVDASTEMVRLAGQTHGVTARVATFDDLDDTNHFDGIWANFSLLHAPRGALPRHIAAIARALRSGGIFHIGMKTGTGTARDPLQRIYTYVTETELTTLLHNAGLHIIAKDKGHQVGLAGTDDAWIVLLTEKKNG